MKIIRPSIEHKELVMDYRNEFIINNDNLAGASYLRNYENYEEWLKFVLDNENENTKHTEVTASVFLAMGDDNNLIGMLNIRHSLNEYLLNYGGHIGYSVRVDERKKGYAKEILRQGLEECKCLKIDKIMLSCNASNIASVKTIIALGGILENEILLEEEIVKRYWIEL